ncbi:MAG: 3-deoxy-D-manno-octulosonic acid transferase [Xanthomonadales bacterium PRO6]|nr:3-deoxy-D-manno-octulosonic acid transferase [Xanthomonadales bacterium PRO6]
MRLLSRRLYTLAMYLAMPVILYRLAFRGLRNRGYHSRWLERFGWFRDPGFASSIWVHAVSVGEFNAAVPLIQALMEKHPDTRLVVTTITPTGSERVRKQFGERVFHVYLPYDLPAAIARFFARVKPRIAVVMETEIWPNLYFECRERGIPIFIANARLSERSLRGYGPALGLIGEAVRCATLVAAQSKVDGERFLQLGTPPERTRVVGNIKFDMAVPSGLDQVAREWREHWGALRPVWIAASTHEGEEAAVLQAHARILGRFPDALLILVPRHPERFRAAILLCRSYGFRTSCRSEDSIATLDTQCFVVDTMGELLKFYACADACFVGGSLDRIGGHNVLEPAALKKPIVIGPHTFNFAEITDTLVREDAAVRAADGARLGAEVVRILSDPKRAAAMGEAALRVVERERGAVPRTLLAIEEILTDVARGEPG